MQRNYHQNQSKQCFVFSSLETTDIEFIELFFNTGKGLYITFAMSCFYYVPFHEIIMYVCFFKIVS